MKVHEHSSTSVIHREALELHTRRNLKLQLVNSASSEPRPPPLWIRVIIPAVVSVISTELGADCHPIEKHGHCQGLGRMMAICKNLPSWGHWEKKEGQHPILEVYYFYISWYVCEPLGPLNSCLPFTNHGPDYDWWTAVNCVTSYRDPSDA